MKVRINLIERIVRVLKELMGYENINIKVRDSYLIVSRSNNVSVIKYLIVDEVDYGVKELDQAMLYRYIEAFSSTYSKLPDGCELKIIKMAKGQGKLIRKIENEMLNIKAILENVSEPHLIKRLEKRLETLQYIYSRLISSNDVERISLIIKIRHEGINENNVVDFIESTAEVVKSLFRLNLGLKIRDARPSEIRDIIEYEIGLSRKYRGKPILVESKRLAALNPIPYHKRPRVEEFSGIYIGKDLDTNWPVIIDEETLYKHILVVGPTGMGKTTTLATIIENYISLYDNVVLGFDYKGDLVSLVDRTLVNVVTPREASLNVLIKPEYVDNIDWALIISDVLEKVLGIEAKKVSTLIKIIVEGKVDEYVNDPRKILMNPDLTYLASVIELIASKPRYGALIKYFDTQTLFNLNGYGTAYQCIYSGIVVSIISYLTSMNKLREKLIVIDEAWRVSRLKSLYTLIKEGRSRKVGVILATQNIEDIPVEILDNIHTLIIFGSHSDEYLSKIANILGIRKHVIEGLKRLSIGEALIFNSLDPHPILARIEPPRAIKRKIGKTTI